MVKPTLTKWCETEKTDGNPFRWYGKYYRSEEHIFKALEINPADDSARQTILGWWTLELIRNYIDWKNSGHPNFEKWGQKNNKQTGYSLTRTYYHEK